MTPWQKDVQERRLIRATVADLEKQAVDLDDPSSRFFQQARAYLSGRKVKDARNASSDLADAADQCDDPDLRNLIDELKRDLDRLVF